MKSLFNKMAVALVILAGLVAYDQWDVWAQKAHTATDTVTNTINTTVKSSLPTEPPASTKTTVVKWQDAQGRWHFGDEAPADVKNAQQETYSSDSNVMQRLRPEDLAVLNRSNSQEPAKPKGVFTGLVNAAQQAQTAQDVMRDHHMQTQQQLESIK